MSQSKEEILQKYVSLYFSSHHDKSRWNGEGENGGAEWHAHKPIAEDIYKAMEEYGNQWKLKYDELKAEHAALKEKAQKMAAALRELNIKIDDMWNEIHGTKAIPENHVALIINAQRESYKVLTEYNTYKSQSNDTVNG